MSELAALISDVEAARARVLDSVAGLSNTDATWRPGPNEWSIAENLEHLVLAEQSGVEKIYRALELPVPALDANPNHGLRIEEVVARTWQPRELAPPIATPQGGGTIAYWCAAFRASAHVLAALAAELENRDLSRIVFPHFLCGPLDARQRLEFLRFHMDRHLGQIVAIRTRL